MSKPTEQTIEEKHRKHQDLMQKHRITKAERREEHARPNRTRNYPPNSLK